MLSGVTGPGRRRSPPRRQSKASKGTTIPAIQIVDRQLEEGKFFEKINFKEEKHDISHLTKENRHGFLKERGNCC